MEQRSRSTNNWQDAIEKSADISKDINSFNKPQVSPMFACDECKFVWQPRYVHGVPDDYYEDFPTYGLKRKTCPQCKEK